MASPVDSLNRPLRELRLSVTDRCNFRCVYCLPKEVFGPEFAVLGRSELLTFEETARLARIFAGLGVDKVRLTGGEPLLRHGLERLVQRLAGTAGLDDIALTTNGSLLAAQARGLKEAGLKRVTVSLDSLDDATFKAMNGVGFPVERVLQGIMAAAAVGLAPVKVNVVVKRGINERGVVEMARHFRGTGHIVRFIEFMDAGNASGWRPEDVVPAAEIVRLIDLRWPLEPLEPNRFGEVAGRYRYRDGQGEIGVIAAVTRPFCRTCTRLRLSADGRLYTCLFATHGYDLRSELRRGRSDTEIAALLRSLWSWRADRYSELRSAPAPQSDQPRSDQPRSGKVEMSYIGG